MADKSVKSSTPEYTMGYSAEFLQLLTRRSAETHAAHLLPHLRPGMRVLDFGCGLGSISVGLARAVEPGEFHGIDMSESQVAIARDMAVAGGHHNATFHVGDVTNLDFEDDAFDVVHGHAVLMHVPDTQAALAEVKRVLKPGGRISCRDLICPSSFFEPDLGGFSGGMWSLFTDRLQTNGGHPQLGKELKRVFHEAGFLAIHATASFEFFGSSSDVSFLHGFMRGSFFAADAMARDIARGAATQEQFDDWQRLMDDWKDHPGAFATFAWGDAVGIEP